MKLVKSLSYNEIISLNKKTVNFISDCDIFPNFNITGKIISIDILNNEYIFKVYINNGRTIEVGSNMKNLQYKIL